MRVFSDPYKQGIATNASRRQDALILSAIQRRNTDAKQAQARYESEAVSNTNNGIRRREYFNFVSGLSEYLTL